MKEFFRKRMVALKRQPSNIPLFVLVVALLVYSLNTSYVSETTQKLYGSNMGLAGFITMLLSILIFVVFLNAFPKRQKPKVSMLIIMYVMFALIIAADIYYGTGVDRSLAVIDQTNPENAFRTDFPYILKSQRLVYIHAVIVGIVAVLVALLPVYTKLLRKVKTSIDVEDNGQMGEIDIAEE